MGDGDAKRVFNPVSDQVLLISPVFELILLLFVGLLHERLFDGGLVCGCREYASRMRSVNVVSCWPFDDTATEETVKSLLPPINVKKFTWWLDQLEYVHSESKKKVVENEDQDMEESCIKIQEHIEAVEEKASRGKMKAPKKRSIVEIFAVAPPVERAFSEDEEDSVEEDAYFISSHSEINWGPKGKRNKKKRNKIKNDKSKKIKRKKGHKGEDEIGLSIPNKVCGFGYNSCHCCDCLVA